MKQRNLRLVPAALLMTTALSWSLPTLAQTGGSAAPARPASATMPSMGGGLHPNAQVAPPDAPAGGTPTPAPGSAAPGASTNGLPPGFEPAMPGRAASASHPADAAPAGKAPVRPMPPARP